MTPKVLVVDTKDWHPPDLLRPADWGSDAYTASPAAKTRLDNFDDAKHGLDGIPAFDTAEATDENPDRVIAARGPGAFSPRKPVMRPERFHQLRHGQADGPLHVADPQTLPALGSKNPPREPVSIPLAHCPPPSCGLSGIVGKAWAGVGWKRPP
ncbi:hypothetical protein [Streptomyces sp. CB02460]|uniref:hypothetical protein n=1 Tax=Streptomyces sp. CB02460 TaxID=1703941 RepID=UPI00116153E5|nr:hypothetical protein [Streptomyces sp. CB02460]